MPDFAQIAKIIKSYNHTLVFTGHTHLMKVDKWNDQTGRAFVIGNGGAPLAQSFSWYGFALVEQLSDGNVSVVLLDQATGNPMASHTLKPL